MFLNQLTEKEKMAFANMFIHIAEIDNDYSPDEFERFQDYLKEMRIYFFDYEKALSMEEVTEIFKNATPKSKKIALFEALDIVSADGFIDEREINLLYDFAKNIGIDDKTTSFLVDKFNKISEAEIKINDIIFEE